MSDEDKQMRDRLLLAMTPTLVTLWEADTQNSRWDSEDDLAFTAGRIIDAFMKERKAWQKRR